MHEDETRTTECAFSIRQAARPRKRTFVTSSAKFQIARQAASTHAHAAHCPQRADVLLAATKRRARRRETPARFPIYREIPRAFCFIKDILYISWFMEVVGFGVSNVFAFKQNSKRRTTRAPSPRFPAIFAPIRRPGTPPGRSSLAPEPQPRQNLKSRITGIFRRPDPAFSAGLSRRTQPVIVRDTRTRRDNPPTGGRESVRRERTPAADARRRSRRPATQAARHPRRSLRPISAPEQGRSARAGSLLHYRRSRPNDDKRRQDAPSDRRRSRSAACHDPPGHADRRTESALHRAIGERSTFKRWQRAFCNIATRILPVEHWTRYAIHRRSEARNKHPAGAIPGAADRRTFASRNRSAGGIQRREHNRLYPGIDRKPGSIRRRLYPFIIGSLDIQRNPF